MASGHMKVRNACPFPVTFYALAGPTLELPAFTTQTAKACLIWFSTRVKGGGVTINLTDWETYKEEYLKEYEKHAAQIGDQSGSGTGTAAGSILGYGLDSLVEVFAVKNTRKGDDTYFGAKKEGVYGNSNLVVYAKLDPACKEDHEMGKIWMLHLETDNGQESDDAESDPDYTVPDLSSYGTSMYFCLFNVAKGTYLYAQYDDSTVSVHRRPHLLADVPDLPFNPATMREYWSVHPQDSGENTHRIKLLNTSTKKWLTCFSTAGNRVGLWPMNETDYEDQHWDLDDLGYNGSFVQLKNAKVGQNLVGTEEDRVFLYNPIKEVGIDQDWIVETYSTRVPENRDGAAMYIMHASTGKIIASNSDWKAVANTKWGEQGATDFCFDKIHDNVFKIRASYYNGESRYLTYYENSNYLGFYPSNAGDYLDQHWEVVPHKNNAGFYLRNQSTKAGEKNYLYYNGNDFALYNGPYDNDQLWVALMIRMI